MKSRSFKDKEAWFAGRIGLMTGSRIKNLMAKPKDGKRPMEYYEFVADLLRKPDYSEENPMARGSRLEPEAIARFEKETGKKVDTSLVIWENDEDSRIAVSPDGIIGNTEAAEVKCLESKHHLKMWDDQTVPTEYRKQAIQYFAVHSELETLYFCFYDPRLIALDFFFLEVKRKEIEEEIATQLEFQKNLLKEVDAFVNQHTF